MTARLTDNDPMPFGTHAGEPLHKVPADYLIWAVDDLEWLPDRWPELYAYIVHVREVLEMETVPGRRSREDD